MCYSYFRIVKFTEIAIFITLFSLWLTNFFSGQHQQIVAFFLIFSIGILHGSNDLAIINKMRHSPGWKQLLISLGIYILTVIVAGTLFYTIPELALAGFIIFSGFHFGEQHWGQVFSNQNKSISVLMYLSYGLLVLFGLFYLNAAETSSIIEALTGVMVSADWYLWGAIICGILTATMFSYGYFSKILGGYQLFVEFFLIAVFGIVFNYADLIWAFAIYFIYWHSIPSIIEQLDYLYGETSIRSFKKYLKSSSVVWMVSTATIFVLFYIMRNKQEFILPLFFAFLGAITFAHSFIINRMFVSKKETENN